MSQLREVMDWLQSMAPLELSEEWDNTGLLLGDPSLEIRRVQTCLTLEPRTVGEAVARQADLVVAHHPLPFKPVKKITTSTGPGSLLWSLASSKVAVYAPHTAWDSACVGINARLGAKLALTDVSPLIPVEAALRDGLPSEGLGAGRVGSLPDALGLPELAAKLQASVPYARLRGVDSGKQLSRVAIACGSGGSLLNAAIRAGCDVFVTGEATYHTCLEAEAAGISLLMLGHFASERFAMEEMAKLLSEEFSHLEVWASQDERDPVQNLTLP